MATKTTSQSLVPHLLSLPDGRSLPPSLPLIISSQDNWNPLSCQLETPQKYDANNHTLKLVPDALELLQTINKPLAVLSICGPYRSGKSYFISRVLGSPGAFKLGHSMQACTRGIWMSTTVLECQEFATIVIDTEGIDAVGTSDTFAMSLLTLTTLLSSFLIYNSKKVPQKMDLDKMRCFSQLSISILGQCGKSMSTEARKAFFPKLLWVLRDVALKMTDRKGKEIGPREFLHTKILATESGELTPLGRSLVDMFPSIDCATLPIPSIKRDVVRNILEQQHMLKPAFNTAIDTLNYQILGQLSVKKALDGNCPIDGKAFVTVAESYVEIINRPGAVPDLDQGWQAVVRLELKEVSHGLVKEYEREMEEAVKGNLPMEEENLLRIHRQILNVKKSVLREETRNIDPLHSSDEDVQPLLDKLEHDTVKWSQDNTKKVTGGLLYQFTTLNHQSSKDTCEKLFRQLLKELGVGEKFNQAVGNSEPLNIDTEISEIREEFTKRAVGPAASGVLKAGMPELSRLADLLKLIPGRPQNVKVIGWSSNKIKLSWDPPNHNPEAVDEYVVYKRVDNEDWGEAARTKKTSVLLTGLKTSIEFDHLTNIVSPERLESTLPSKLSVVAINNTITSLETSHSAYPQISPVKSAAFGLVTGAAGSLCLPYVIGRSMCAYSQREEYYGASVTDAQEALLVGLSIVAIPLSIALAPITAPVLATATAIHGKTIAKEYGDITED